jgi:microcystin-dependent protein
MHSGEAPGLAPRVAGDAGGSEAVTLTANELPAHTHALRAHTFDNGDVSNASSYSTFAPASGGTAYQPTANANLAPEALGSAGGGEPHNNLMPYITFCFNIALEGEIPERS